MAVRIWVHATFWALFVMLPTHAGIHCTQPQVPIRATPASMAPRSVVRRMPGAKISATFGLATLVEGAFDFSDSGMNIRGEEVRRAGIDPIRKHIRPPLFC